MNKISVGPDQVAYRKKVGKLGDSAIIEVGLIGGLHLIAKANGTVLGSGPHRGVARHIAKKRNPEIEFNDLSKADWIDPQFFQDILPVYEQLTDDLIAAQG